MVCDARKCRDNQKVVDVNQLEFGWDEEPPRQHGMLQANLAEEKVAPAAPELVSAPSTTARKVQVDALHADLKRRTGLGIQLTITDNTSTIMSVRLMKKSNFAKVRLHHLFLECPEEVCAALAAWISKPKSRNSGDVIDQFIREERDKIRPPVPKPTTFQTTGHHHDLKRLYDEVNCEEFFYQVNCPITWGKMPRLTRTRRSIRFGSYSPKEHLIRIHPLLDQAFVPRFLVRYIIFHEMLHANMGIEKLPSGRRAIHPPAFRLRERCYADFDRACEWIDKPANLKRLLAPYRRGRA